MKEFPRSITVDYSLSIYDMVRAGRFDWHNQCVGHRWFPLTGSGTVRLTPHLIMGHGCKPLASVEEQIRRLGYTPGRIEHLLALAASEWQPGFECCIMAPASQQTGRQQQRRAWISIVKGEQGPRKELHMGWIEQDPPEDQIYIAVGE